MGISVKKTIAIILTTAALVTLVYFVNKKPKNEVIISTNNINLSVGEAYRIEVSETEGIITYESENPEVAIVDSNTGIITATGVGTTKITVKTEDESIDYIIEVIEAVEEPKPIIVNDTKDVGNAVVSSIADQIYTGYPITPEVEVILDEKKLENTIDYNISYSNNTEVGTAQVTIVGIGNYSGSKIVTFKIEGQEETPVVEKPKAEISCSNKHYNGTNQVIASCNGGQVNNATQRNMGDYTITCVGDSNHSNADNKTCSITKKSISDTMVSSVANQPYTGKAIKPNIVVIDGTTTLKKDTDYTVSYNNNVNVGIATITVTGKGSYDGTITTAFKIVGTTDSKQPAVITCSNKTYSGSKQTIASCSGGTIKNAQQTNVGNYVVTCTGDSNHLNASNKTCSITTANISTAVVTNIADQTYTGSAITPTVTVKLNGKTLTKGTDYTVSYSNNTNAGTATVTITGKGNYTGTKKTSFTIVKPAPTKTPAVITCLNKTYNGSSQTIATCSGGTVKNNVKTSVGNYVVTCTGDSSHTDATSKTCKIEQASIANAAISSVANQKYTGSKITPSVTVTLDNKKLTQGTDYTVAYSNNINVGTATITITGKGNYKGSKNKTFNIINEKSPAVITCSNKVYTGSSQTIATCSGGTVNNAQQTNVGDYTISCTGDSNHTNPSNKTCSITKADVSNAEITSIANQTYTGSPISPTVTVKLNGKTLTKGTDYTVTYSNNTNVGTATVTVTGKGNYTGTKQTTFKIVQGVVNVTGVSLNKTTLNLTVGSNETLSATVSPSNATDKTVTWSSNKTSVATVSNGKVTGVAAGTATITATAGGKSATCTVTVTNPVTVTSIQLKYGSEALNENSVKTVSPGSSITLTATVSPSSSSVTWSSSNANIATVSNGKVVGVKQGVVTITATAGGKSASTKVKVQPTLSSIFITSSTRSVIDYDSTTLKYWAEYKEDPEDTSSGYYRKPTYMVTHIWVEDANTQLKSAVPPKLDSNQTAEYPRAVLPADWIINNMGAYTEQTPYGQKTISYAGEISNKGYQNKGLLAFNANAMVSMAFNTDKPKTWFGTPCLPLVLSNGKVIRDSSNMTTEEKQYNGCYSSYLSFIDKDGILRYEKYCDPKSSSCNVNNNINLTNKIINTYQAKTTFGFRPPILSNGSLTQEYNNYSDKYSPAPRQALCQLDSHNFILVTTHLNGGKSRSSSCGESNDNNCPYYKYGLTIKRLSEILQSYGCVNAVNLDGGGSISYMYKKPGASKTTRVYITESQRDLADVLYFVEK